MTYIARSDNRIGEEATWLSQKGLNEICAAVIRCAYDDYVRSSKTLIALSGDRDGENIQDYIAGKEKGYMRYYKGDRKGDGILTCLQTLYSNAEDMQEDCRRFFTGQRFQLFASGITGTAVMRHADRMIELWASDKIKSTGVYLNKKIFRPRPNRKKNLLFSDDSL